MRTMHTFMMGLALVLFGMAGYAAAGDAVKVEVDVEQLKEDAKAAGRYLKREGEHIADKTEELANRVADEVKEAWEEAKQ